MWGKGLILVGLITALAAVIGWAIEPLEEPHAEHDEIDDGDHDDDELEPALDAGTSEATDD